MKKKGAKKKESGLWEILLDLGAPDDLSTKSARKKEDEEEKQESIKRRGKGSASSTTFCGANKMPALQGAKHHEGSSSVKVCKSLFMERTGEVGKTGKGRGGKSSQVSRLD